MAYGRRKKNGLSPENTWWGGSVVGKDALSVAFDAFGGGASGGKQSGSGQTRSGQSQSGAVVALTVNTPDGDYQCITPKVYTDKSSVIQDIDDNDGFITLSSFSKSLGALTVHNAKVLVIKNVGLTALELLIEHIDWRNDSGGTTTDVVNSVDMNEENSTGQETVNRFVSMLLPVGDFIYLPNTRLISYSPLASPTSESAGNAAAGDIGIEPKDINSGNEYRGVRAMSGSTYGTGTEILTNEPVAIGETAIDVDDGDWFEVNDLIMIDSEVMSIESISSNTLTVKRGLLGSVDVTHTEDDELLYFFGNEYLAFDNGKCQTDQNGNFKQRGAFWGYARTADKKIKGIVPGSIAILRGYTEGGYLDWGLQNIKASDETGLAASTAYAITFVIDEYNVGGIDSTTTEQIVSFTTDASDTTFASSGNAVIPKIQAQLDAYFYDTSSGLKNKKVTIALRSGDIRVQSHSNHSETRVGISVSTSGTTPFDVGRFPSRVDGDQPALLGSSHGTGATDIIVYGPASSLPQETIDDTVSGKTIQNTNAFLIDDGNGNLTHNGQVVGWIDYAKGHCEFSDLPNAEFKIYAESLSAHSGGITYLADAFNSIQSIGARSTNSKQDGKVELILLG